jgi:hypothetical protein
MSLTFFDSAYPLSSPLPVDGVCFYIGGDAVHIWTAEEIEAQPARYRLPVFVRSNPGSANASNDVVAAASALHSISAPAGCLVAWDTETADDPLYINAVYRALKAAGYTLIVYGSQSVVTSEGNPDGLYWGADWTGSPHLHSGDVMTQYVSFNAYDESVAIDGLPFWDTKPGTEPAWQEAMMQSLPTLTSGAGGTLVRSIQGLCGSRGFPVTIDGEFGPATEAAVKAAQKTADITQDGIVGPATWRALITGSSAA